MLARRALFLILPSTLLLGAPLAAQTRDPVAAEALFSAGREAFERGDYAVACVKFEESQRLDPAAGTAINLAACNERRGKLATASGNWRDALALLARDDSRRPRAEQQVAAIEARLARLVVELAPGAPPDTRVSRDGVELGAPSFGIAIPIDAGEHVVEAIAPGRETSRYRVTLADGQTERLAVAPGAPVAVGARASTPATGTASPPGAPPSASEASPLAPQGESGTSGSARWAGYALGAGGLAALTVGGVTGLLALDRASTIENTCDRSGDGYACDDEGLDAADSGKTLATVSTVSFAVGGAALAAGVVLVLTSGGDEARPAQAVRAELRSGGAGVAWTGSF